MKKRVKFMVTAFRDGFQSVFGARVFTKDFLPAVEAAVDAGMDHFEAGGGARFQSLYFYCNEDAFDMMEAFRKAAGPEANLQTLARGVNVVGLDSQPRDIIKLHADLFAKHGISTIRNFDALNDVNNLIYSGKCIVDAGLKHEVCVTLMELPPGASGSHSAEFYIDTLKGILDAGIPYDSVCFKDASGTAVPSKVYETIKKARELLGKDKHITFHTHETAGISIVGYKAALEAGADQIDLSLAPVSGGTCQPDVITMWHALRGTEFDLGVDIKKVMKAEEVFKDCMKDYFMPPEAKSVEPLIPFSPMPGGALTANTQMMRDNGILDKYAEVAAAMGEVVERGGFGTSVTPVSQFYFQQAFNNVMIGPWKKIAEGYGKMVLGYFGKTPIEPDPAIVKLAQEQIGLEPTTKKVVDINDEDPTKGFDSAKAMLKEADLPITDENVFIAATCKEKGIAYLKGEAKVGVRKKSLEESEKSDQPEQKVSSQKEGNMDYTVIINGTPYDVHIEGNQAVVNGVAYDIEVQEGASGGTPATAPRPAAPRPAAPRPAAPKPAVKAPAPKPAGKPAPKPAAAAPKPAAAPAPSGDGQKVEAPLPGLVIRIVAQPGTAVKENDVIMVLESMKMETEIYSPAAGTVESIEVKQGDQVQAGTVLAVIS
jgi:pyruvate carboxylase subunit B